MNLLALNTKAIGYWGAALVVLGLLTDAGFAKALLDVLPHTWQPEAGKLITAIGAALAYFGRPTTVKG